ncbi:MAG: lipocalin family protein [Bacteroidales bacterium]|nr:lipocalin family protein [Bacteroidales bacterium]
MKKFFILTALLAVFGLTSCEKEPSKAIVGTWEAVKMEATIAGIDMTMDMSEWKMKMEFTFNADGTGSMLLETEGNSEKSTFEYTVNGNLLSLIEGDETSGIPISFDKKTMVAEMSGEIFGLGDNGAKVKVYFEKK